MSSAAIQLLVLAGIAIFLIVKLKSALGTREGFEKPPVVMPPAEPRRIGAGADVIDAGADHDITDHVPEGSPAARALAAMKAAEPNFSVASFLQGARGAYEMILMAFETGKLESVRAFVSPEVYDSLAAVVEERARRGLEVTAEFVGLRELALHDAEIDPRSGEAEITVRFVGEVISYARDAAGQIVEGDSKAARKQRDVWTFARKLGVNDPNWQLVATGE